MLKYTLSLLLAAAAGFVGCEQKEIDMTEHNNTETVESPAAPPTATFAGGCFWGIEHNFQRIPGVLDTKVGYMGGDVENPSYKRVCYEDTGHAEVVQLRYNPNKISYEKLVRIFFILHDPTTLNRQGPDVGSQYRSAIFYHTPEQEKIAQDVIDELNASGQFRRPIVTEITPAETFWKAEDYHQQYIKKNPMRSCHMVDVKEIKKILADD